jgi:hypothetical protein
MKIRLMGLPAEVSQAVKILRTVGALDIIEIDSPYSSRQRARREDTCPDCDVWPGDVHTSKCGARDSGQEIWPGFRPHSRMIRIYIEAQLRDETCLYCENPDRWP